MTVRLLRKLILALRRRGRRARRRMGRRAPGRPRRLRRIEHGSPVTDLADSGRPRVHAGRRAPEHEHLHAASAARASRSSNATQHERRGHHDGGAARAVVGSTVISPRARDRGQRQPRRERGLGRERQRSPARPSSTSSTGTAPSRHRQRRLHRAAASCIDLEHGRTRARIRLHRPSPALVPEGLHAQAAARLPRQPDRRPGLSDAPVACRTRALTTPSSVTRSPTRSRREHA